MSSAAHRVREALITHALRTEPVPESALRAAAIFLEDTVMVGLAGAATPERARLLEVARGWSESGPARLWGDGLATSTANAALVHAYQIHCQEFDCVHEPAVVHPMAVIGGALLSWAQAEGRTSGRELLEAIAVGVDAATVLGMMARAPMRFFRPAMCGALGASLALARLAGFDPDTTRRALGLTYCQISGNMQAHLEGTPGLALQIGFNARAALSGHELALAGMAGPIDVIDGPFGYLKLIEPGHDSAPVAELGRTWQIERVSHKPFPTGRAAHAALDGLEHLLSSGLDPNEIEQLELRAPPLIRRLVDRPARDDMTASYARLCLPWLISLRLTRGRVGLEDFSAEALADPERSSRTDCLLISADDNADPNALAPQLLIATTRDGKRHEIHLSRVLGAPERPLDEAARSAKASACWTHAGWPDARGQALLEQLRAVAGMSSLAPIFDLLTCAADAQAST